MYTDILLVFNIRVQGDGENSIVYCVSIHEYSVFVFCVPDFLDFHCRAEGVYVILNPSCLERVVVLCLLYLSIRAKHFP